MASPSVEALLSDPSLYDVLTTGTVFLHKQQPLSSQILALAECVLSDERFEYISARDDDWILSLPSAQVRRQSRGRRRILVFETCGDKAASAIVMARILATNGRRGVWFLGMPSDLPAGDLFRCDLSFYGRLPIGELSIVQSATYLSDHLWGKVAEASDSEWRVLVARGQRDLRSFRPASYPAPQIMSIHRTDEVGSNSTISDSGEEAEVEADRPPAFWVRQPTFRRI